MKKKVKFDNISIVLKQPRCPENIGAAARAISNMGMGKLVIVDPENCDLTRILKMATHFASDVVEQIEVYDNLQEAISPYNYVVGTTARLGKKRRQINTPSKTAENLVSISGENLIAILFGPEDKGLTNEDIRLCDALVNIPTAKFSSLNLAQAVMIICYEIFIARQNEEREFTPRLASRYEMEGMYEQLKEILVRICYISSDNPDYWMNKLRNFFSRLQLQAREVSVIRGICRQIDWYGRKCYNDGHKSSSCQQNPPEKR
jgi:tRNA/rRNA methyltransferase